MSVPEETLPAPAPARPDGAGPRAATQPSLAAWFTDEVLPHERPLRAHLRRTFPSMPDVDDIIQDSYCRLIQARKTGQIRYVKAFLFATARNAMLDLFRRRRTVVIESVAEIERLSVLEEGPGVADRVGRQQELTLLADAIHALPERCRQVLTLRKLYGLSQQEIAAQLGISEHTVEVQVAKGMRRVAASLARHGLP